MMLVNKLAFLALIVLLLGPLAGRADTAGPPRVALVEIDGPIGPAVADHVAEELAAAAARGDALVILRLDTPGGLVSATRTIVQAILGSPVPVAGLVGPPGARAASAGTYILYATHIAAMAPGTNLGAATPVAIGGLPGADEGEGDNAGARKAINDAAASLRSLAQLRGRNVTWAESAVTDAESLTAEEALKAGVIDLVAANEADLLRRIDGRTVALDPERQVVLDLTGAMIERQEPSWRTRVLSILTDPSIAYILLLVGIYGIVLEFYSPGMLVPGITGAVSLLLALYAFQMLPISFAGLALLVLGLALLVAEAMAPGIGVLGLGGVVAFTIGSIMLVDTGGVPGFGIAWPLIGSAALVASGLLFLTVWLLARSRRQRLENGPSAMIGAAAHVVAWRGDTGEVRLLGELWQARGARDLAPGDEVRVAAVDGLVLKVEPAGPRAPAKHQGSDA